MDSARGPSMSSDSAARPDPIEDLVVEYLRRRGLTRTLSEFGAESGSSGMGSLAVHAAPLKGPPPLGSGRAHCNSFALFHEWVSSSVDIFREELLFVSFGVFVAR